MSQDSPSSSRRDFLLGRALGRSIEHQLEKSIEAASPLDSSVYQGNASHPNSGYLEQFAKNAMACEFEFSFNLGQYPQASSVAGEAFQELDRLEAQMTVYRDDSEISRVNLVGHQHPVVISAPLIQLLQRAKNLTRITQGAFDVTSGHLSQLWGFERRAGKVPQASDIQSALQLVGDHQVLIDEAASTVALQQEGVKINLGGIGKGFALDELAQLFADHAIHDFVLHGGQSSLLVRGSAGSNETVNQESADGENVTTIDSGAGWRIGITHPNLPEVRLAEVTLRNCALGTSGTARQGFFHRGKRYGHVIDPRTGWPAGHFLSSTVIADRAETADALATAFFVMSLDEIEAVCASHPEISAIIVHSDQPNSPHVNVTTLNVPDDDWRLVTA